VKSYPLADALLAPVLRVAMPQAPDSDLPSAIIHVVSRCKDREFAFLTPYLHGRPGRPRIAKLPA